MFHHLLESTCGWPPTNPARRSLPWCIASIDQVTRDFLARLGSSPARGIFLTLFTSMFYCAPDFQRIRWLTRLLHGDGVCESESSERSRSAGSFRTGS